MCLCGYMNICYFYLPGEGMIDSGEKDCLRPPPFFLPGIPFTFTSVDLITLALPFRGNGSIKGIGISSFCCSCDSAILDSNFSLRLCIMTSSSVFPSAVYT